MNGPSLQKQPSRWEKIKNATSITFGVTWLLGMIVAGINEYNKYPVGAHVFTSREVWGMTDLDKTYDELARAWEAKDEYGLAEITEKERAILFPKDTYGLVTAMAN